MTRMCLYQYAGVYMRNGEYKEAENLYSQLKSTAGSSMMEIATYKEVEALRSQSEFDRALKLIQPLTTARNSNEKMRSLFLRGRIRYQMGNYRDAYSDFQILSNSKTKAVNHREALFWKGLSLEKLGKSTDATSVFRSLATDHDYLAFLVAEKITAPAIPSADFQIGMLRAPSADQENAVADLYKRGELLPAFLYLHLYKEAALELDGVPKETWDTLGINANSKPERYLAIAQIAQMGSNFATATYYSEMFLKNLPKGVSAFALPQDVLKVLYPFPYQDQVEKFSRERNVDPLLVLSIMKQESKFKPFAKSPSFARGLMQLIPPTAIKLAATLGIANFSIDQLYNPDININLGTKFLQDMIARFGNRLEVIAAGYNSGEDNVQRWLDGTSSPEAIEFFSNIDFPETRNYVMLVKTNYEWYKRIYSTPTK